MRPLLLAPAIVIALLAVNPPTVRAQSAGTLPDSTTQAVDKIFARFDRPESPGCAVGVGRDGRSVYERGYGSANLEYGVPITPATVFESGSVAKQFTASAIVLLAQDGKLGLDDDVRKYIPEVPNFGETIRIRHLLNHTSGLRDQWGLLGIEGRGPGSQVHSPATTLDLVRRQKQLNFPPGTQYLYSNTGFTLLGIIVQRVSGQSLDEFTQARLFRPLGMTSTQWRDDFTEIVKGRATAYSGTAQSVFKMDMPFTNMIGNGGLLTTVGDLLKWNENLQNPTVGGAAYVDSMQTRARLRNGRTISYALGIEVDTYNGVREVSHGGSTAGYRTFLARYPEQRLSVAVLCNLASANAGGLAHQVADVFLPKQVAAAQSGSGAGVTLSQAQLERWAGRYIDPGTDRSLNLVVRDGALVNEQGRVSAVALAPDRFRIASGNEFVFAGPAGRRTMKMITPAGDTSVLVEKAPFPSTLPLNAYVGTYSSEELDVQLEVALKDGKLVLRRRPADELAMRPIYADDFETDAGSLRFTRDKSGKVSGFSIFAGRVLDVRFHRTR